jgi:hypothetical protein
MWGITGVYSTIWYLWYKTRAKEEEGKGGQQAELNRLEKGVASGCAKDGMLAFASSERLLHCSYSTAGARILHAK